MKGKRAKSPPESAPDLKLTPPPDEGKKPKKERKSWSGTWVEKETTKKDNDGGKVCAVYVRANLAEDIARLEDIFKQFAELSIETIDGKHRGHLEILDKTVKIVRAKPGEQILTMKLAGPGTFSAFVGRNVTVDGRQRILPIGEVQGEPR